MKVRFPSPNTIQRLFSIITILAFILPGAAVSAHQDFQLSVSEPSRHDAPAPESVSVLNAIGFYPLTTKGNLSPFNMPFRQSADLDPTALSVRILSSPYAILDSNDFEAGPRVFVVEAEVQNTGTVTATNVTLSLDYNQDPANHWILLDGEVPQRNFEELEPGETSVAYWFASYANTIGASHQYTVTASADNADPVSTWHNEFLDPAVGYTVITKRALSAENSDIVQYNTNIVVGAESTITIQFDLGTNPDNVIFSPVGNLDFSPGSFRLASTNVRFYDAGGTQEIIVNNQLYFPTIESFADKADVTLVFIALVPGAVSLCPYAGITSGPNTFYDNDFCIGAWRINIDASTSFFLEKSADRAAVLQNEVLTYTIQYANTGLLPMKYVWVWDPIDATIGSILLDSIDPPADLSVTTEDLVGWYLNDIPPAGDPGSSGVLTFTMQVDGNGLDIEDGTQFVNNAFFGITQADLPDSPAMTSTVTSTVHAPVISITKTDSTATAEPGDALSYVLEVQNTGSVTATNIVITDVLPVYLTPVGSVPAWDQQEGGTVTWNTLDPIAPNGGSIQVTLDVVVDMKTPNNQLLTNTTFVEYQNTAGHVYALQSATDDTTVHAPVLTIEKEDSPDPVLTGNTITYTLTYANSGLSPASNVVITDTVPVSTSFLSCTGGCVFENEQVRWELASLPDGEDGSVSFTVQVSESLETGSLILNDDYGISSDQTHYVSGAPVETTVNRKASIVDGYAFGDNNGNGQFDAGESGLSGVTVNLPNALVPVTTTNSAGYYSFRVETGGQITVSASLPAGYFRTTPGSVPLQLVLGIDRSVNFGYADESSLFGVIYGTVYEDDNSNRNLDPSESRIGGVTVESDQAFIQTVTTNDLGQYILRFDAGGDVTITETNPSGYVSTTPDSLQRTVVMGSSSSSPADFGDFAGVKVAGQVFDDSNVNGVKDEGEGGLAGALLEANGDAFTTDHTGVFTLYLRAETPDAIVLTESDPPGYLSTVAIAGAGMARLDENTLQLPSPVSGTVYTGAYFGDVLASDVITVTGLVWEDNGPGASFANGTRDPGEPGLALAEVGLSTGVTTTSAADGGFLLYAPRDQEVTLYEINPDGYISTNAVPGTNAVKVDDDHLKLSVTSGDSSTGNLFGDVASASTVIISGHVFDDQNKNGILDTGESGIPDVAVQLDNTIETLTGPDGEYTFLTGSEGNHVISETDPDGYFSTTPNDVHLLTSLGNGYQVDFGDALSSNAEVASVYGTVFNDLDKDGTYDEDEVGISGVTITLDGADTVTTGQYGIFAYAFMDAGQHSVKETDPPAYASSTPNEVQVTVALGNGYQVDFGDFLLVTCSPDTYEEDDIYQQAKPVQIGPDFRQEHNFCYDPSDWLSFDVEAGRVYTVTTSSWGQRADTFVTIYDQDGTTALAANDDHAENEDLSSYMRWQAPKSGTYYLEVASRAGQTGDDTEYDVWVVEEAGPPMLYLPVITLNTMPVAGTLPTGIAAPMDPQGVIFHSCPDSYEVDDTWEQAQPIVAGEDQLHSFDSNPMFFTADKDVVWFDAQRGDKIRFSTEADDQVLPYLALFDDLGNALRISGQTSLEWDAQDDGRYYLSVSPQTGTFGCVVGAGYTLHMERTTGFMLYLPLIELPE